ncbi:hypothetical protein [Nocardia sp. NPDC057440]|uniref:hypothetical protein n=1 Tax=Nocardia sp. NPDC057440 TaxID=3346134 RepID=UPI00366C0ABE
MPDGYDASRRNLSNYEKGLYFELGRAQIRDETPDRGWVKQFEIRIGHEQDRRRFDSARTDGQGVRSVERKSGRVNESDARGQLGLEREALDSGQLTHSTWETVEGEKVPDKVLGDMQELERDFPGQFRHEIVSRADAARAIQLGQSLMSKQLELIRAYELTRADRARKRLEKIREIVRVREEKAREREKEQREKVAELAKARERAEKFERMQQFREAAARGRVEAPQRVQAERDRQAEKAKARAPETERERVQREAAERAIREFPFPAPNQTRDREAADAATVEREDKARAEREAAKERERESAKTLEELNRARDAAFGHLDEGGRLSEAERLAWSGQAHHPRAAVLEPPGHAPSVERGGTGQGQDRARGISRER